MHERKLPPRNYLPIPVVRRPLSGAKKSHQSWVPNELTGKLKIGLEVITPVHVGTGSYTFFGLGSGEEQLAKDVARRQGQPIVPGSSLKGLCRNTFEALAESGEPGPVRGEADRAAAVFGSLEQRGFLSFDDAACEHEIALQLIWLSGTYSPSKDVGRRFYGPQPEEADQASRCPALAIPAGTELHTTLHIENLPDFEVGIALLALGIRPRFDQKVGGGKYDRFGWVRFSVLGWTERSWPEVPEQIKGKRLHRQVAQWCRAARAMLQRTGTSALEDLKNHMRSENDLGSPS